jgi:hypothetical protein
MEELTLEVIGLLDALIGQTSAKLGYRILMQRYACSDIYRAICQ